MTILLDECLPLDFRHSFPEHNTHTAQWAGFKGFRNGDLIRAAESKGYDVLLTVDSGVPHQKPASSKLLSIIVIVASTNQLENLLPFVESIRKLLRSIQPGQTVRLQSTS